LRRGLLAVEHNQMVRLSPNGTAVAFLRIGGDDHELWLRPVDGTERRLAALDGEIVGDIRWSGDGQWVLFLHVQRGRELWRLSAVDLTTDRCLLMPVPGIVTEFWVSRNRPAIAVSCRPPGSARADLFRLDLKSSEEIECKLLSRNPGFHRWLVDGELSPRGGTRLDRDGSVSLFVGPAPHEAREKLRLDPDTGMDFAVLGFSRDGARLYVLTSWNAPTRRLLSIDLRTQEPTCVFSDPSFDVAGYPIGRDGVWFNPITGDPDLCATIDQRLRLHPLDERLLGKLASVKRAGAITVPLERDNTDSRWLVAHVHDDAPMEYEVVDTRTSTAAPLFLNRPNIAGYELSNLDDFTFLASDGRPRSGYIMRPRGSSGPQPTVVLVHGGPAARDYWRFYAEAQYLATLGITSLHINYLGSRGFGVDFRRLSSGEWGARMQQDLYEAVDHGVATGLIDPARVGYFGTSYGGYAALLAATTQASRAVRCAVAIGSVCDLVAFATTPPAYWQPLTEVVRRQITVRPDGSRLDDDELRRRSPAHVLQADCAPLLIAHGVRDPRVSVSDVDRFVTKARELGVTVNYLRFDDEGHYIKSNANLGGLFHALEDFLRRHLL
jgi:dipeptidyl aminopeptidase/acylaminoacyl peptidase